MLEVLQEYGMFFYKGIGYTLALSFFGLIFGTVVGLLVTLMRLSKSKILRFISGAYIAVMRGTPLFVQLFIIYIGVDMELGISISPFVSGLIAISLNSGAYVSEIIRSGIQSIDKGQMEAGRSLGLSEKKTMRYVVLPQAIKNILPALGNEFVTLVKETSIVSTIGVTDLMYGADKVTSILYNTKPLFIAAIFYFIMTFTLSKVLELIEKKVSYND